MAYRNSLVEDVQKDHDQHLSLITQFRNALSSHKKKEAKEILDRLDKALAEHFGFEVNYLYPRMRRLILEMTDKLCSRQEQIKTSIKKSQRILGKDKVHKNRLSTITDTLDMISNHLEDCSGIVSLANCFGKEEKNELGQRFYEYCIVNDSKPKERRVRK